MEPNTRIDIEAVIRKSKLRNSRIPEAALMGLLFQSLRNQGHPVSLHFRLMIDEGRSSLQHPMFAIGYENELWTVNGKGDWKRQMELALCRNCQYFRIPKFMDILPQVEQDGIAGLSNDPLSAHKKTRDRIEAAVSFSEAAAISNSTQAPTQNVRKSPRL